MILAANGDGIVDSTAQDIHAEGVSFDTGTNVLDQYEEGTVTSGLALTGSTNPPDTITYTTRLLRYTRIGNRVDIKIRITINAFTLGSGSGFAEITGLPFTAANEASETSVGSVTFSNVNYAGDFVSPVVDPNTSRIRFVEVTTAAGEGNVSLSDFAAGDTIVVQVTYWI